MFNTLLKTEFSTKRLTNVANSNKSDLQVHLSSQMGMLQPLGDQEMFGNEKVGQLSKLFCERIDVVPNDRLYIGSDEYTVKSIKDYNYGTFPHFQIIIAKLK